MKDFVNDVGLGPAPLGSPGSAGLVAFPVELYQTPNLDLTVPNLGIELIPAKPGHFPVLVNANWIIDSASGTQTTPPTTRAGSDAGHVNFASQTSTKPSNASVNGANVPSMGDGNANAALTLRRIPNAPVIFDIVAGAQGTGTFAVRGRFSVSVNWVSVKS